MKMMYKLIQLNRENEERVLDFGDDWDVFQVEIGVNSLIVILVKNEGVD